jgi:predicted 2-oxoglutarate/Fe(II)-dependent dioxygenase YbiX
MKIIDYANPEYPNVRIIKNFLDPETVDRVRNDIENLSEDVWWILNPKREADDPRRVPVWEGNAIDYTKDFRQLDIMEAVPRKKQEVNRKFDSNIIQARSTLTRWRPGRKQTPHLDYFWEEEDHDYEDIEKHSLWNKEKLHGFGKIFTTYHYSTMLYLNDDFTGGELYFPQYGNFEVKPEPGMLVMFSGNDKHLHGVKEIKSGIRYVIASFWEDLDLVRNI